MKESNIDYIEGYLDGIKAVANENKKMSIQWEHKWRDIIKNHKKEVLRG